jgi:hypothetical protein
MPTGRESNKPYTGEGVTIGIADHLVAQFFLAYRSLCPSAWIQRWDDQRGMVALRRSLNR